MNEGLKAVIALLLGGGGVFAFAVGNWILALILVFLAFLFIPENWTPKRR